MRAVTQISMIVIVVLTNLQQTQLQSTVTAGGKLSSSIESLSNLKTHINNLSIAEVCYHLIECFISEENPNTGEIKFYVHNGYCMIKSKSATFVLAGYCPYIPKRSIQSTKVSQYYVLPNGLTVDSFTDFTCSWHNREGDLCRKCKAGYGPAVYAFSLMCAECSYCPLVGWTLHFVCVLFPITVFYIFVIIFNIQATVPPMSAYVLMCQTFCMIDLTYAPLKVRQTQFKSLLILLQIVRALCGVWNLDFFSAT